MVGYCSVTDRTVNRTKYDWRLTKLLCLPFAEISWVRKACNVNEFSTLRALVVVHIFEKINPVDFGILQPESQSATGNIREKG